MFTKRLPRLIAAVDSAIPWPMSPVSAAFDGHDFILFPETDDTPDRIEMQIPEGEDHQHAMTVMNRFMSALAWVQGKSLRSAWTMIAGGPGGGMGKGKARFNSNGLAARCETLIIDYLPAPVGENERLALALYREALNCNSIPYSFLGFAKILNMIGDGRKQVAWINATIPKLTRNHDYEANQRIAKLTGDLGKYIYEDGRCAIAHAEKGSRVNPDMADHERRLADDMPVVRVLAEYFIEYNLGIKSQGTMYDEHLYELSGFRDHLGSSLVAKMKAREDIDVRALPVFPPVGVRVRGGEPLPALERLTPIWVLSLNGTLAVQFSNGTHPCVVAFRLNFAEESLEFDPATLVTVTDSTRPEGAQVIADRASLLRGLLRNKQLHVYRMDTGALMGRTDGFVPDDAQWHEMKALVASAAAEQGQLPA